MRWEGNPYAKGGVVPWPEECLPARIWLVGGPTQIPTQAPPGRIADLAALLADYERTAFARQFGNLRLRLFDRRPDAALPSCPT